MIDIVATPREKKRRSEGRTQEEKGHPLHFLCTLTSLTAMIEAE